MLVVQLSTENNPLRGKKKNQSFYFKENPVVITGFPVLGI